MRCLKTKIVTKDLSITMVDFFDNTEYSSYQECIEEKAVSKSSVILSYTKLLVPIFLLAYFIHSYVLQPLAI